MKLKQTILGENHEIVFIEENFFDDNALRDIEILENYCHHYLIGKFANRFNISIEKEYNSLNDYIIMIVSLTDDNKIFFPAFNETIKLNRGGIAAFKNIVQFNIFKSHKEFKFFTKPGKKIFGNGSNKYQVACLIQDMYKIDILANTEEEARLIAKDINISYWDHPGYGPEENIYYKVLMRHAKWGNFIINKY